MKWKKRRPEQVPEPSRTAAETEDERRRRESQREIEAVCRRFGVWLPPSHRSEWLPKE